MQYRLKIDTDSKFIQTKHELRPGDVLIIDERRAKITGRVFEMIKRGAYEVKRISLEATWID